MGRTKPTVSADYVVGLTDGEGCFYVNLGKNNSYKSGVRVQLHFHIKLQEKDRDLLEKIKNTLDCGNVYFQKEKRQNHTQCYRYTVASQKDIFDYIIPFFQKNPLQTASKSKSFKIFCKIASLVGAQRHLSESGIKKITKLKLEMNKKTDGLA